MARSFASASSQYITGTTPLTATPFTMAAWINPPDTSTARDAISISHNTLDAYFAISIRSTQVQARLRNGSENAAIATTSIITGQWQHVCSVFASSTSRSIYHNGGNKGTNTTSNAPTGIAVATIGGLKFNGGYRNFFNGLIAHATMWNIDLTDDEVAILPKVDHRLVRPESIVAHWEIFGRSSPEPDFTGRFDMTVSGATQAEHPKIVYQTRRRLIIPAVIGGGGGDILEGECTGNLTVNGNYAANRVKYFLCNQNYSLLSETNLNSTAQIYNSSNLSLSSTLSNNKLSTATTLGNFNILGSQNTNIVTGISQAQQIQLNFLSQTILSRITQVISAQSYNISSEVSIKTLKSSGLLGFLQIAATHRLNNLSASRVSEAVNLIGNFATSKTISCNTSTSYQLLSLFNASLLKTVKLIEQLDILSIISTGIVKSINLMSLLELSSNLTATLGNVGKIAGTLQLFSEEKFVLCQIADLLTDIRILTSVSTVKQSNVSSIGSLNILSELSAIKQTITAIVATLVINAEFSVDTIAAAIYVIYLIGFIQQNLLEQIKITRNISESVNIGSLTVESKISDVNADVSIIDLLQL